MKKILLFFALSIIIYSCANIGSPDGGRYDEEPPKVVRSTPAQGAVNYNRQKVKILFNEYVKLTSANEKVVVSPPQMEAANVRADGKYIKATLYDSLLSNTTYTIDFSDAIEDNNEGNPMGNYTFSFSTGPTIDTMEVSGTVLNAQNLEPIKGILVGLYPVDEKYHDSIFRTKPLSRVSRTNGSGHFIIKGVSDKFNYRIFALNDADGNYTFSQKSELIAFDTTLISTHCGLDYRTDTIWHDYDHKQFDSIMTVPYTHFYPDNIVLRGFQEDGQELHLLKTERPNPDIFSLFFTAHMDSLPQLKGLNFDESCLYAVPSAHNDTITYWVTDTTLTHHQDTLSFSLTYLDTDSTGMNVPKTDTLELVPKTTYAKILKEKQKNIDNWEKAREKKMKKSKKPLPPETNPFLHEPLDLKIKPGGSLDLNKNISIEANQPISRVDSSGIHLYHKKDSDWLPEPFIFAPDPENNAIYTVYAEWKPAEQYRLTIDTLTFTGIMGNTSNPEKKDIRVKSLDDYGTLSIHVLLPDSGVIVQLMSKSDKVVYQGPCDKTHTVDFFFLKPSQYYVRCFIDRNGNGKWDTGNYDSGLPPEETFYFTKPIDVRAKWEIDQDWDPRSISLEKQKPLAITKQKPDKQKQKKNRNAERKNGSNK